LEFIPISSLPQLPTNIDYRETGSVSTGELAGINSNQPWVEVYSKKVNELQMLGKENCKLH